jgi:CubicO group peptidase (beta-lactamase class C family)
MLKRLDSLVPKLLEKFNLPGIAICFISKFEISSIETYGFVNIEKKEPINEDTVFQICSISKPVTAWGVMKLVERKLLDLDDPVEQYLTRWHLPPSEFNHDDVTIRRVLSHSAGLSLSGYLGTHPNNKLPLIEESLSGITPAPLDKIQLAYCKRWDRDPHKEEHPVRVIHEPGTVFYYSGGGYSIIQLIIEEVTNQSFDEFMKREILIPLKMKNSSFNIDEINSNTFATPYDEGEIIPNYKLVAKAAGGLCSTIKELAHFVLAPMKYYQKELIDKDVISFKSIKELYNPIIYSSDEMGIKWYSGLAHFVGNIKGAQVVQHSGGHVGWRSMMMFFPKLGKGIVLLVNSSGGNPLWANILMRWLRKITNTL